MFLSISSYSWMPSSFLAKLPLVQEAGLESVEIFCTPRHLDISNPEQVQEAGLKIRELGLRNNTMHAPVTVGDLSNPDESQREETMMACQKALDAAMLLGATTVTFHPASIEGEMIDAQERYVSLIETLRDLSGYAEDRDVKIAIENLPSPFFGSDPYDLYKKINDADLPNVGLCLDIGHAFVGEHFPTLFDQLGDKVYTVHASDNRGRVDEHMTPGEGYIDWNQIIAGLKQINYQGPFIIEVRDGRPTHELLQDAVDFADKHGLSGVGQLSH